MRPALANKLKAVTGVSFKPKGKKGKTFPCAAGTTKALCSTLVVVGHIHLDVFFIKLCILYWGTAINKVVTVSGGTERGSAIHIHVSNLPQTPPTQAATRH